MQKRLFHFLQNWFRRVINTVESQKNPVIEQVTKKYKDMYELDTIFQQSLHNIEIESEKMTLEDGQEKTDKRKNAMQAPIRETIQEDDSFFILDSVRQIHFVGGRKKAAMILMYLTGLRVSHLLFFTVRHTMQLVKQGETSIPLIKRGVQRFSIRQSEQGKMVVKSPILSL